MSESEAMLGYGSIFEISTDAGSNWTEVAEVLDITPPADTVETVDVTHQRSPNRTREFIEALADPGDFSFEMNFIPGSDSDALIRGLKGQGKVDCRLTFPNGVRWSFKGIRTSYEPASPVEGKMTASVGFKVTGSYTTGNTSAPTNTALPAISGVPQVGEVLTAWPGLWTGAPTFAYQWKNEGVAISGATASTYTPVVGDVGDTITVTVTGTNSAGSASATSAAAVDVIAA